jgi:hypothetical protein
MATTSYSEAVKLHNSRCYAAYNDPHPMSSTNRSSSHREGSNSNSEIRPNRTSRVTTDGSVVQSSDPTTDSRASFSQKLKGNISGAVRGTIGSIQGATGSLMRNKNMEEKGVSKMQDEDQRLAAKRGVMPVGSGQRLTTEEEGT